MGNIGTMKPTFETERLRIRAPQENDRADFVAMSMDIDVMRFISDGNLTEEGANEIADMSIDRADRTYGAWTIEELSTGEFLGWVVLMPLDESDDIEVGYGLVQTAWGRGIATEAARCLVDYGFGTLGLDEIVAITRPENVASQNVLQKVGLERDGFRDAYGVEGHFYFRMQNPN